MGAGTVGRRGPTTFLTAFVDGGQFADGRLIAIDDSREHDGRDLLGSKLRLTPPLDRRDRPPLVSARPEGLSQMGAKTPRRKHWVFAEGGYTGRIEEPPARRRIMRAQHRTQP
jgi:hypothetical protein